MAAFLEAAMTLARVGLAVLPLGDDDGKKPLVKWRGWKNRPGQAFLEKLSNKFPDANIGVICGLSGVTVVDIDDASLLSPMIERFGETPLKIGTPSGGVHLWYRSSGEACSALRSEGLAVDLKGFGGQVAVPPSIRMSGPYAGQKYEFIAGSWADLARLPSIRAGAYPSAEVAPTQLRAVRQGHRNNVLFRSLLRHAKCCDDIETLFDVAATLNADFEPPLSSTEVAKTVVSVWEYESKGRNWVGREQRVYALKSECEALAAHQNGGDGVLLLLKLRMAHWGHDQFAISPKAMAEAQTIPGWGVKRYRAAIGAITDTALLQKVHRGGSRRGDASLFSFSSFAIQKGARREPNITKTPPPSSLRVVEQKEPFLKREENLAQRGGFAKVAGARR